MSAYASRTNVNTSANPPAAEATPRARFADLRAEATVQRRRQALLDASPGVRDLLSISRMQAPVAQMEMKEGLDGTQIDVTVIADCLPNFLTGVVPEDADYCYCRNGTVPGQLNDTDYFYLKDDKLVPILIQDVNAYWDPKYEGFTREGFPVLGVNCEDYATGGRLGDEKGTYAKAGTAGLAELLSTDGNYVVNLSYHWLKVAKAGDSYTISQKDGESAVYTKVFTREEAVAYICDKTPATGTVYAG